MNRSVVRSSLAVGALIGLGILVSCEGDVGPAGPEGPEGPTGPTGPTGPQGPSGVEVFRAATLTGAAEVPANASTGTGSSVITSIGGQLLFRVDVGNINNVTRAHIHGPAAVGANAGIVVALYEQGANPPLNFTTTATLAQGVAPLPTGMSLDSLLALMRNGNAYVNVHTNDGIPPAGTGPGDLAAGEIRGQIAKVP